MLLSIIVPTLNEENHIGDLLASLQLPNTPEYEAIVVDGASTDRTSEISKANGAVVEIRPKLKEFPSRNVGAEISNGDILVFTGADVIFPPNVLQNIADRFRSDPDVIAVAGPGVPITPPLALGVEYSIYNLLRFVFHKLPKPFRKFSTSTNMLAIRRDTFFDLGGFTDDVNADGLMGASLLANGKTIFGYQNIYATISSRRLHKDGFWGFNKHFFYVLENFVPISKLPWFKKSKQQSYSSHSTMRQDADQDNS